MQAKQLFFDWFDSLKLSKKAGEEMDVGGRKLPVVYKKNAKARNYLLYVREDHLAVTVPRYGTMEQAREFVRGKEDWVNRQWAKRQAVNVCPKTWVGGTEVYYIGEMVRIDVSRREADGAGREGWTVRLGNLWANVSELPANLRPLVEGLLLKESEKFFPGKVFEMAEGLQLAVARVQVRNQKTRWGSCSQRGTISLNWRLIQTPPEVQEYIIVHELMHLREMNHSPRFWQLVERVCPDYRARERWLKLHTAKLGM